MDIARRVLPIIDMTKDKKEQDLKTKKYRKNRMKFCLNSRLNLRNWFKKNIRVWDATVMFYQWAYNQRYKRKLESKCCLKSIQVQLLAKTNRVLGKARRFKLIRLIHQLNFKEIPIILIPVTIPKTLKPNHVILRHQLIWDSSSIKWSNWR